MQQIKTKFVLALDVGTLNKAALFDKSGEMVVCQKISKMRCRLLAGLRRILKNFGTPNSSNDVLSR